MVGHRILIPGIVVRVHAAQPIFSALNSAGLECLSSKQEVGSSNLSGPANKENAMKSVNFKNRMNGERVVCDNIRDVKVIDGVEYLTVRKVENNRQFLMRKEALEKVKEDKRMPL